MTEEFPFTSPIFVCFFLVNIQGENIHELVLYITLRRKEKAISLLSVSNKEFELKLY